MTLESVKVWLVNLDEDEARRRAPLDFEILMQLDREIAFGCIFRGVSIAQLEHVLRHGVDVSPTDSVIYADGIDKAWEYGGYPKLILALEQAKLERANQGVRPDTTESERRLIEYTRLPEPVSEAQLAYAEAYGWWIPDDARGALRGLIIAYPDSDIQAVSVLIGVSAAPADWKSAE
jgi:hypothetical protein